MAQGSKSIWPKPVLGLIAASHSQGAMEQFRDYVPDDHAWDVFEAMCRGMLDEVRPHGSSCVIMSALLAVSLEDKLGIPVPVIAGALKLDGHYMYGSNSAFDGGRVFSEDGPDWDGHCWLLFGKLIVDISLGRTARLRQCRAPLADRIVSVFGDRAGLIALPEADTRKIGLHYLPRYVLTPDQALANAGGAVRKFGL